MDMKKIEEIVKRQDALEADNKLLKGENDALKKRIEVLEKTPEPPKGAKLDEPALTKSDDTKIDLDKGKKEPEKLEPVDMIKQAHSEPRIYSLQKPLG